MALQKQSISINFAQGVDQSTDPFQIPIGSFEELENSVYSNVTGMSKRNGFGELTSLPSGTDATFLTTFNGNLTAISETSLNVLAEGANSWVNKGTFQPLSLKTMPLVRNNTNQTQADIAVSSNGLVCTAYSDSITVSGSPVVTYKYVLSDSTTGQILIPPTTIPTPFGSAAGAPRVFALGNYFVVIFSATNGSVFHLQYIAISMTSIGTVTTAADITTGYAPDAAGSFDGTVVNGTLYIAWNSTAAGGVKAKYMTSALALSAQATLSTHVATNVSLTSDSTQSTPVIWMTSYDSALSTGYVTAMNPSLILLFAAVQYVSATVVKNVMAIAQNGVATIYYEVSNAYTYDSGVPTNYIKTRTVNQVGTLGTAAVLVRSVGLASKGFILNDNKYFLAAYQSPYQPTYFLLNSTGQVISRLAYSNGGGYLTLGLPNVYVNGSTVSIPYLNKDSIQSVNKGTNNAAGTPTAQVYSQTGVNLVTYTFTSDGLTTSEIGSDLHLNGGFLWMYDGAYPIEHNFFLWPDSVELTAAGTGGLMIAQTYFYQVTYEWTDNQGNAHRSAPSVPVSVTTTGTTSKVTVHIPTLRLTYKTATPLKIVIYRWSTAQQTYFQTTSITAPVLNDTSVDYLDYVDTLADTSIIGNNILYTNGGVVENIGAPGFVSMGLFDTRLFGIVAEDPDLLWYSKQVIEATPVEMSDLFTIYVSPTAGAQGSTGPMKCLAPMDDKLILFKKNAIYYINGTGPDNTGANSQFSQPTFITSTVGCENQNSIVMTPAGLMFQSDKGIWLLSRDLSTKYVGKKVQNYNSIKVNSALSIPGFNHVRFTLDSGVTLVYDYFQVDQNGFGQWGTFTGVPSISSALYQDLHTYVDSYGKVFQETPGQFLDGSVPVLMAFKTGWINAAGVQGYQRAYKLYILATYISPHKMSFGVAYDYESAVTQISNIMPDNYSAPWGSDTNWGSGEVWGGPSTTEQWEVNFERQQCQTFQLSFNEFFDASIGSGIGEGLSISTLDLVVGLKKQFPGNIPAKRRV